MSVFLPQNTPPEPTTRDDRLPLWVIVLLVVFLALRVFDLWGGWKAKQGGRLSQTLVGQVDEKTMSSTITTNWAAKTAFFATFGQPGQPGPDRKSLQEALKSAEMLQTDTHNAPASARRVIILRALLHLPLLMPGKNHLDPAQAFQPAALTDFPPEDQKRYAAEGRLWADVARGPHLSPVQTDAYAAQIRAMPNIRWWQGPAQAVLYQSQGNPAEAAHYTRQAQTKALLTMGPLSLMRLLYGALGLGGLALLIYQAARWWNTRAAPPGAAPLPNPWPTLPENVPLGERRLRVGDLMGVFVLYLLMPDILGWLLGGFGPRRFHFPGLLAGYKHQVTAMSAGQHVAAVVVLEFSAYLLSALLPIGLLIAIARRRGASLGLELGWNRRRLGVNLLYGVGGYAVALPLVIVAGLAGPQIFRHAPAPSNPAIPLLAGASSVWVQALLVLLATVAAPLTEELLFRGVFYNAAKLRAGVWPGIVLTGLVFGFVHPVGIAEMLPLAVLGGVFAWMAETRKSLAPSILAHCMQNTMATLMLLLALGG